jgi:hypothetical protein
MARRKVDSVLIVTVLLGLLGIFLAPWFVPREQVVCSASYTLGFNNVVASLALVALLAALFVQLLRRPAGAESGVGGIVAQMLSSQGAGSRRSLLAFCVMTTLIVTLLLGWYRIMPFIIFGEFASDVSRLDQMVLGLRPYRDFQYNYGPAMLYPPYWLYLLFGGKLSIDGAFCATLLVHWVAGLSLVYYAARTLCRGRWQATIVFVCISLAVFNFSMGVAYTPLRFMPPIASLLFLHRRFSQWVDGDATTLPKSTAVAMLLSLGSLSLSPEVGIATVAGITTFFATLIFTPFRRFSVVALAPVFSLGIAVLVFSVKYADGVLSFGSGANNFPVFPSAYILFFVAAGSLILPRLGVIGVRERNQNGALAMALVVALGMMIPGAFGRCDPLHVLFNGLGILILFLALAVQLPNRAAAALVVGAFVLIHPIVGNRWLFGDQAFRKAISYDRLLSTIDKRKNAAIWQAASGGSTNLRYGKLYPFGGDVQTLSPQLRNFTAVGTPFYPGEDVDRFLKLSGRFFPEYYSGFNMQVFTPSAVSRKIRDLGAMEVLIVPKDHNNPGVVVYEADARALADLLLFPSRWIPTPRRQPYIPGLAIMKYITDNFTVVGGSYTYDLMRRNTR